MKISIGGMIGVGKTTFSEKLAKVTNLPLIREFNENDEMLSKMLDWMYKGYPNSELILQTYFINHTHQLHLIDGKPITSCITDRHLIEHERFAYFRLAKKDKKAYAYYMALFNQIIVNDKLPDLYIILEGSFDFCLNNIIKRGRKEEIDNLEPNLEYFKNLHSIYNEQLIARCTTFGIPTKIINVEKKEDEKLLEKIEINKNYLGDLHV